MRNRASRSTSVGMFRTRLPISFKLDATRKNCWKNRSGKIWLKISIFTVTYHTPHPARGPCCKLVSIVTPTIETDVPAKAKAARAALDAWTREMVEWHFNPETGCPFWLDRAATLGWDPRKEVRAYDDLDRFGFFEDDWLRGGPVTRWVPKAYTGRPVFVFETGGSTGIPKSRISIDDFRIDYEAFSATLPDDAFPHGADWLMIGPSGPRRLRLAVEHLAQY